MINTFLHEDKTLDIYDDNQLLATIENGRDDEDFIEDILFGMGYVWHEDGTVTKIKE